MVAVDIRLSHCPAANDLTFPMDAHSHERDCPASDARSSMKGIRRAIRRGALGCTVVTVTPTGTLAEGAISWGFTPLSAPKWAGSYQ